MWQHIKFEKYAGVVELVDTLALGASARIGVEVRVLSPVPYS